MNESPTRREPSDQAARQQALDPVGSFIVQAPAGSGKTGLLVRRFLRLLTTVELPEQILAITFTRKATAEMRLRILNALQGLDLHGHAETDTDLLDLAQAANEHGQRLGWHLVQNPRRLKVQTIDSFCHELVRRMPWSSRFGTVPPPVEDAFRLYLQAADDTLRMIEDLSDPDIAKACARVLSLVNADRRLAQQLLANLLANRDRWMKDLTSHSREQFEQGWDETIRITLQACNAMLEGDWRTELATLSHHAAIHIQTSQNNAAGNRWDLLSGWTASGDFPLPESDELDRWQGMAHLLLTQNGTVRKTIDKRQGFPVTDKGQKFAKERFKQLLKQLACRDRHILAWNRIRHLPQPSYLHQDWEMVQALLTLLPVAVAQLRLLFKGQHLADFTEIAQRADWALGVPDAPSDLTLTLDYQLRHILLDEFQDTSIGQLELLKKLLAGWTPNDGRTVFLVGDPMQSIYRFRDAEVGIFLAVQEQGIGDIRPHPLTLTSNFRSAPALVDWFNGTFSQIMPDDSNMIHGAVRYTVASPFQPIDVDSGIYVHTNPPRHHEVEAEQIVAIVAKTLERFPGEDIAVLGRTRSHLSHLIQALNAHGIPYQGIQLESLAHRPAIQDLMSLTLVLAQPGDRIAWLSLLRAPWGGATLSDLVHLVGTSPDRPIFESLQQSECLEGLSSQTRTRLLRVREVLSSALLDRSRCSLHHLLESCWLRLGGPVAVDPHDLENCRRYLDRVRDLVAEGTPIHRESLTDALADLYAENAVEQPVRLMTIHSAKGLEFHTVILVGLERLPKKDGGELIRWKRFPDRLLVATRPRSQEANGFYTYLGRLEDDHQMYERQRLLYVACTRAQRRLHLFGKPPEERRSPGKQSLLALLWPVVEAFRGGTQGSGTPDGTTKASHQAMSSPILHQLDPSWTLPELPDSLDPVPMEADVTEEEDRIDFDWARESTRVIGIVIHRILQQVDHHGWAVWKHRTFHSNERDDWRRQLLATGLPPSQADPALERLEALLVQVQKDPLADWIFSPLNTDVRTEWSLTGVHQGEIRHIVLDRCFVDPDGVRWIVDFKSSRHEDRQTLDTFLDQERERYQAAMTRYRDLLSALEGRPVRTALYYPVLGRLVEYEVP